MRHLLTVLLAALPLAGWCATAADFIARTLPAGGGATHALPYRLLLPAGYSASGSYPLILFLHGSGEMGTDNQAQLLYDANGALALVSTANRAAFPCFMLAPQAHPSLGWNAENETQIATVIGQLLDEFAIDRERIYVTGLSMGGGGTWDIATRFPALFAAAVPQSAGGAGNYQRIVDLPVWVFHANNDSDEPVSSGDNAVAALRNAGGRVIYTRYGTGGHHIWPVAYQTPALLPWMMAQRRHRPATGTPILAITTPASAAVAAAGATISLAGTCAFPAGSAIDQVRWTTNLTTFTDATATVGSATCAWSANGLAVADGATRFTVIASGPSWWPAYGGATTVSDSVRVVRGSSDTTPPALAIVTPSASGTASVGTALVTLGGTASDASGVQQVSWTNDRGGQGTALGTTSWSIADLALAGGVNLVTVTARDGANLTTSRTIAITATGGGGGGGGGNPGGGSAGSGGGCGLGSASAALAMMAWLAATLRLRRARRRAPARP
jgi:poly(3-hydroxybutyrate) depolymerase